MNMKKVLAGFALSALLLVSAPAAALADSVRWSIGVFPPPACGEYSVRPEGEYSSKDGVVTLSLDGVSLPVTMHDDIGWYGSTTKVTAGTHTFTARIVSPSGVVMQELNKEYVVPACETAQEAPQAPAVVEMAPESNQTTNIAPASNLPPNTVSLTAYQGIGTTTTTIATTTAASSTNEQAQIDALRQLIALLTQIIQELLAKRASA